MRCPKCNFYDTTVKDSRPAHDKRAIRRRRLCNSCGHRFTSYEVYAREVDESGDFIQLPPTYEDCDFLIDIASNIIKRAHKRKEIAIDMPFIKSPRRGTL